MSVLGKLAIDKSGGKRGGRETVQGATWLRLDMAGASLHAIISSWPLPIPSDLSMISRPSRSLCQAGGGGSRETRLAVNDKPLPYLIAIRGPSVPGPVCRVLYEASADINGGVVPSFPPLNRRRRGVKTSSDSPRTAIVKLFSVRLSPASTVTWLSLSRNDSTSSSLATLQFRWHYQNIYLL